MATSSKFGEQSLTPPPKSNPSQLNGGVGVGNDVGNDVGTVILVDGAKVGGPVVAVVGLKVLAGGVGLEVSRERQSVNQSKCAAHQCDMDNQSKIVRKC